MIDLLFLRNEEVLLYYLDCMLREGRQPHASESDKLLSAAAAAAATSASPFLFMHAFAYPVKRADT